MVALISQEKLETLVANALNPQLICQLRQLPQPCRRAIQTSALSPARLSAAQSRSLRELLLTRLVQKYELEQWRNALESVDYHGRRLAKLSVELFQIETCLLRELQLLLNLPEEQLSARYRPAVIALQLLTIDAAAESFNRTLNEQKTFLNELSWDTASAAHYEELARRFLDRLLHYVPVASAAILALAQPSKKHGQLWVCVKEASGASRFYPQQPAHQFESTWPRLRSFRCVQAPRHHQLLISPNLPAQIRTLWSVPLVLGGRFYGAFQLLFDRKYPYLPAEKDVLFQAALRFVVALEKLQLVEELEQRQEQLRQLTKVVLEVEERERSRISRELHDEAGQSLMSLRLQLELLKRKISRDNPELLDSIEEIQATVDRTIQEIRRLIAALNPSVLEQLGLEAAVRHLVQRFKESFEGQVYVHIEPLPELPGEVARMLYRIVQESLNNIQKHAQATTVRIQLSFDDQNIRLEIQDDGKGFELHRILSRTGSFGLNGMRERVRFLNGELQIVSHPGEGTTIRVKVPRGATAVHEKKPAESSEPPGLIRPVETYRLEAAEKFLPSSAIEQEKQPVP